MRQHTRSKIKPGPHVAAIAVALPVALAACGASDGRGPAGWTGTIDTLPSGQVVVHNTATPLWPAGQEWRVTEELRLGSIEGDGPDLFGRITSFEIDAAGRFWVLDGQAQELRVFSAAGEHVRTIGRRGGGPGEFAQAVRVEQGPDGNIWVMDPRNNRLSILDTAGVYLDSRPALGGFVILPWPGRFDGDGRYYTPVPRPDREFRIALVRHGPDFTPLDTLEIPRDPVPREHFDHTMGTGRIIASVPYQGSLTWRLSPRGTIWALVTDQYRFFELDAAGDTLRTVTREFAPLPVTAADRDWAREDMKWFTDQGGRIDLSKLPRTKPPVTGFFVDDQGNLWFERVASTEETGHQHDVFDDAGRFLGTVRLPFPLSTSPWPIVRDGVLYGLTRDDLEVQYIVRARIVRP